MDQAGSVIKIQPAELTLARPAFQPTVVSSPANVFHQEVRASNFSEERFSWNWRSPSANLLCSPLIHGVFRIKLKCPYNLSKTQQVGPLLGVYDCQISTVGDTEAVGRLFTGTANQQPLKGQYGYRPLLSFSSGNSVMCACESKSITINGSTWTELNSNLYLRSLDKCYVPDEAQQRAWSTCGGCPDKQDSCPLSGHVLGLPDSVLYIAGTQNSTHPSVEVKIATQNQVGELNTQGFRPTEGATMDSGLRQRMSNFYDQIVESDQTKTDLNVYTIEIKFPIAGSVFNDQWGAQDLARSDPRLRMALGLPHINNGQITLSFKDLFKQIIRRYGRPNSFAGAPLVKQAVAKFDESDIQIELDQSYAPRLRLRYIRLPSFRMYPQSSSLAVYRREVRRPEGTRDSGAYGTKAFGQALWGVGGDGSVKGLQASAGRGNFTSTLTQRVSSKIEANKQQEVIVNWTGVQFPQPPSYIFIVYQKDPSYTTHAPHVNVHKLAAGNANGTDDSAKFNTGTRAALDDATKMTAACSTVLSDDYNPISTSVHVFNNEVMNRNIGMASDSNAAIVQLEITVQSAIGSFAFVDSTDPYLTDRDRLFRKHVRNCHSRYCEQGRGVWQGKECCALLQSSDYLLGLQTSPGTQYPITLDVRVKFQNKAVYSTGLCFTDGISKGKAEFEDIIIGTPVLVGCFHQNVLSIAASSAVQSSQAFSQATTASALASSQ